MSSAKRTPRFVEAVPNLRIVGPTVEAQVIPIRRVTPAYTPVFDAPESQPSPRTTKRSVPVARRPWQVLLVPATPGAPTRTFQVARWQAQAVMAALALLLILAGGAVVSVVAAVQAPDLFVASADVALLRSRLTDVEDSLATMRDELASGDDETPDSAASVTEVASVSAEAGRIPAKATVVAKLTTRKPAAPRASRLPRDETDLVAMAPRSADGLPVVGMIASGFSRSRRHPVLHIRRPHLGVDVAAPRGTPITAPAPGRVISVGRRFGYGLVVEIQHSGNVRTRYAHMKAAMVHEGQDVTRGVQLGTVGSSGITTGPHLHYEILVNGHQVDPLRYRLPQAAEPEVTPTAVAPAPIGSVSPPALAAPPVSPHDSGAANMAPSPR
jgi:murein DD-endopeptidase MepM/ murein hydrolase activator NlpD